MSDFWSDLAAPEAAVATPEPPAPPKATRKRGGVEPRDLGSVPFADAWLVFTTEGDGIARDVRVMTGSHLNRRSAGQPRDWTHDIGLYAYATDEKDAADPAACWRGFLARWQCEDLPAAMRAVARVEGLEWLWNQAMIYEEVTRG